VWRPSTTHAEMMQHWITVRNAATYEAGFGTAFVDTGSWQAFVCALETHYGIDRRAETCAGTEVPPDMTNATCYSGGDDDDDEGWPWWYIGILWFSGVSTVVSCGGCIAYFVYQWTVAEAQLELSTMSYAGVPSLSRLQGMP